MPVTIPRSILGNQGARVFLSENDLIAELQRRRRPIADISFKNKGNQTSRVNGVHVGTVVLTEARSDPMVSKTLADPHLTFVLPIAGSGSIVEGRKSTTWSACRKIMSLSFASSIENHNDGFSWLSIHPNLKDLVAAIADISLKSNVNHERLLTGNTVMYSRQTNDFNYYDALEKLLSIVGQSNGDGAFLERIGLDDVFIRTLAQMLVAEEGRSPDDQSSTRASRGLKAVDIISSYIQGNIGKPLTITKMERMTGLSGRALNYAFHSRFDCSPQEWQRNYLLDEARKILSCQEQCKSIKEIAFTLGFSSTSSFCSHYKKRFGERPSETGYRPTKRY